MKLWLRFAAAMAIVSLLPLLLSIVVTTRLSAAKAERSSEDLRARDAAALSTFVETWMQDQALAVAGWMQLYPLSSQSDTQRTGLLRAVHRAVPSVVSVAMVSPGRTLLLPAVYLPAAPPAGDPLAGRTLGSEARAAELLENLPLEEALLSPGIPVVGTPYLPAGSTIPVAPVATVGPYGEGIILAAEIELTLLLEVATARSDPGRGLALLDRFGRAFIGAEHPLTEPEMVQSLLGNTASVVYEARGLSVRGALAPIRGMDWSVLVAEPSAIAARDANEIRRRSLETFALAIGLALIAALALARTLSDPIADLTSSALAVADGDLGKTVATHGTDEIGQLSEAFNLMSRRLAENRDQITAQRDEIESFNRELQARVEERTRELERAQDALVASGQLAAVAEIGAGLAHELNNPLAGVLGIAQVLRARGEDPLLVQLVEQAERCRRVAEEITRLSSPDVVGENRVLEFSSLLDEVLPPVRATARQRGVTVTLEPLPDKLRVRADPTLASRAIVQLLLAITAGLGAGGTVGICAERASQTVRLVLTPDRPVDEGARRDDFLAAGVSLWVARQLVAKLGGQIRRPDAEQTSWTLELPGAS